MKFFFRHKDYTTPRTQQGTHTISMTERDYRLHNDNNVALKFRLSEKTEQMIDEICTYLDTSASDFIRQVLFSHLYGRYDLLGLLERKFPVLDESTNVCGMNAYFNGKWTKDSVKRKKVKK